MHYNNTCKEVILMRLKKIRIELEFEKVLLWLGIKFK